jgi:hypothetical protein
MAYRHQKDVRHVDYVKAMVDRIEKRKKLDSPLELTNSEKKRIFFTYANFEMLAHVLAYHVSNEVNPGANSYNVLDDDGVSRKYRAIKIFTKDPGIVAFAFVPNDADNSRMHVVFRGTSDLNSVIRDLEYGGAGHESFFGSEDEILQQINGLVGAVHQRLNSPVHDSHEHRNKRIKFSDKKIKLSVSGHSLGGGDAQNCAALIIKAMAHNLDESHGTFRYNKTFNKQIRKNFNHVESLKIAHLNSVGVTNKVAQECAQDVKFLAEKSNGENKIDISLHALRVANDRVQDTGQSNILNDISPEYAKVEILHARIRDQAPWYSTKDFLTFLANILIKSLPVFNGLSNLISKTKKAHGSLHFTDDNNNELSYFSNRSHIGRMVIKKHLTEKSYVENATITSYFKSSLKKILKMGK